jgi:hypothetical protein
VQRVIEESKTAQAVQSANKPSLTANYHLCFPVTLVL